MEEGFRRAHLVFVGTALDIPQPDARVLPGWRLETTTFEIEETLKSPFVKRWESGRITLAHTSDNCDPAFEPGVRYLVFAWWKENQFVKSSQ